MPAATAKSFSVATVTAVMSIASRAVPIRPVPIRCIEQPSVTAQHAVDDTIMRIASVASEPVNEKK
ncbi:MAG: hypothetical protein WBO18_09185 [Gammaproteobacteria bacterium]